jgi:hypothetical protein
MVPNPDDGVLTDIRIDLSSSTPIILPVEYETTEESDTFQFNNKIDTFNNALSKLILLVDDNNIDIRILEVNGLEATVELLDDISLVELIGKKIIKIREDVMEMYVEKGTSSNLDLYTNIASVDDLNLEHINTRIGNVLPFIPSLV